MIARVLAVIALAGCDPDHVIEPGVLNFSNQPAEIEVPSSATVGEAFVVRCTTFGDGCVSFERTDLDQAADGADVFPLDRRDIPSGNGTCPEILLQFHHDATLSFDSPGTKEIRFHGRNVSAEGDADVEIAMPILVE